MKLLGRCPSWSAYSGGTKIEEFSYSPDDNRWKQHSYDTDPATTSSRTTYYVDGLYQRVENKNDQGEVITEQRHHVGGYLVHTELSSQDTDQDGIEDHEDNCKLVINPNQVDADSDGFGNMCDTDLTNDGITNFADINAFSGYFNTTDPVADFNVDGAVNFVDFSILQNAFLTEPGPGAVENYSAGDRYLLTDNLGSVDTVVTEDGEILEQFGYTAFGKRTGANWVDNAIVVTPDGFSSSSSSTTTAGFTGHEHLDASGWIHMNGRAYDPDLGRFSAADPFIVGVGNGQSLNAYSYVWNSPLNGTDPTGYAPHCSFDNSQCNGFERFIQATRQFFRSLLSIKTRKAPDQVNAKYDVSRTAPQANDGSQGANSAQINVSVNGTTPQSDVNGAIDIQAEPDSECQSRCSALITEFGHPIINDIMNSGLSLKQKREFFDGLELSIKKVERGLQINQRSEDFRLNDLDFLSIEVELTELTLANDVAIINTVLSQADEIGMSSPGTKGRKKITNVLKEIVKQYKNRKRRPVVTQPNLSCGVPKSDETNTFCRIE